MKINAEDVDYVKEDYNVFLNGKLMKSCVGFDTEDQSVTILDIKKMVPLNIVDGEREYVTKKLFGALLIHKFVYEKDRVYEYTFTNDNDMKLVNIFSLRLNND